MGHGGLTVVADDRADEAVAVKLLIASLADHCPDLPVTVWFPPATEGFARWATRLPQVTLRTEAIPGATASRATVAPK